LIVAECDDDAELFVQALRKAGYLPVWWRRVKDAGEMAIALAEESWDVVLSRPRLSSLDFLAALTTRPLQGVDDVPRLQSGIERGPQLALSRSRKPLNA
jgi:hypothetical protein